MLTSIFSIIMAVLIWSALHSITASLKAKALARQQLGERNAGGLYRLLYNLVATFTFVQLLGFVFFFLPDQPFYRFPSWLVWPALLVQIISVAAVLLAIFKVDIWSFLGLRQLQRWVESLDDPEPAAKLVTTGMFACMRHPIYFFSLVAMWAMPVMSVNQFTLFVCFTLYFWVGSIFEERKLVAEFGEDYKQLQSNLPRIVPFTNFWKKK